MVLYTKDHTTHKACINSSSLMQEILMILDFDLLFLSCLAEEGFSGAEKLNSLSVLIAFSIVHGATCPT